MKYDVTKALLTKPFYTTKEVAELLQIAPRTVLDMLRAGDLSGVKVVGKWRVTADDIIRYVDAHAAKVK